MVSGRKVGGGVVVMMKGVRNGADNGGRSYQTKKQKNKLITAGILPTNGQYFL